MEAAPQADRAEIRGEIERIEIERRDASGKYLGKIIVEKDDKVRHENAPD